MEQMTVEQIEEPTARLAAARIKSTHQQEMEAMMRGAGQQIPDEPTWPSFAVRKLRARLCVEEGIFELLQALHIKLVVWLPDGSPLELNNPETGTVIAHDFLGEVGSCEPKSRADLVRKLTAIADACIDSSVVTRGTLSACGIADELLLREVDGNNLLKFRPGHSIDAGGKLCKPADHQPPRLGAIIEAQIPLDGDVHPGDVEL
jgi:hypothetical protein